MIAASGKQVGIAARWLRFITRVVNTGAIRRLTLFGIAAAIVFLIFPQIDQWFSRLFYLGGRTFVMSDHPIGNFFDRELHIAMEWLLGVFVALYLFSELLKRPILNLDRARFLFVIIALAVGVGLIVNTVLKDHWGRARPHQTVEFGGDKRFTPAFVITDQCPRNCSFVSGDAALGFGFVAFAMVMRRNRTGWIAAASVFGATIGMMRIMRGAHFLSDVVFAAVFTILTILVVKRLVLDELWREAPTVRARGPA